MDEITITIDGQTITTPTGTTILKAAEAAGITIPTLCYHDACTPNAVCRTCMVEVEGARVLVASCAAVAGAGMVVHTDSERIRRSRRTVLEMLASTVDISEAPEVQQMMVESGADPERFPEAEQRQPPIIDDNPMYIRDYAKCVLCWRCVQVCAEDAQYTFALNFSGRGFDTQIGTYFDNPMPLTSCVFCGQCVGVCPTNALKPKREWLFEQGFNLEAIHQATMGKQDRKRRVEGSDA